MGFQNFWNRGKQYRCFSLPKCYCCRTKPNITTSDRAGTSGATTITVTDVDASGGSINVGDIISFFTSSAFSTEASGHEDKQYEVTAINITTNVVTIRELDNPNGTGLVAALAINSYIRRRWKFYDLFDGD